MAKATSVLDGDPTQRIREQLALAVGPVPTVGVP